MISTAEAIGLEGIGVTDHCNISERPAQKREKYRHGFNLDRTYDRRRRAIEELREETDIRVFDAVEMDYDPREADSIETFLEEAQFEYAIGSVHYVDERNVTKSTQFKDYSETERRDAIETYVDTVVSLAKSELFEIGGHLDVVERNSHLRGLLTSEHYNRVAKAFSDSRTVPEINAGSITREYGEFHPAPTLLDEMLDRGIEFTLGSDAHRPPEIRDRVANLRSFVDEGDLDPVYPFV